MRNLTRRGPRPRRKGGGPALAGDLLAALLAALGGGAERARLSLLWQNWEQVMGPELAPLALPLGHHKDMLLIGAEDAMLMQELHLMSGEILERVNAFMENPFFTSVKVTLVLGKNVLNTAAPPSPTEETSRGEQSDAQPSGLSGPAVPFWRAWIPPRPWPAAMRVLPANRPTARLRTRPKKTQQAETARQLLLFRQLKQDFKGDALKPQCEKQRRAQRSGIGFRRNGASGAGVALPAAFGAA